MINFIRRLRLDLISFWGGFIAATLFWWLFGYLRPALRKLWGGIRKSFQSARQGLQTSSEQRHRADTLKYVQGLHLSAVLFSLDEIAIPPRLLAPPPLVDPDCAPPYEGVVSMTIPYAPDWPELAATFGAHTLGVAEALQGGVNLAIIGPPGSGKTTALAHLASQIARQDPETGLLQNHIPVFLHANDLELPAKDPDSPLETIIAVISSRASALTLPRLPEMLRTSFDLGKAILLVDGLDEMAPQPSQEVVDFLNNLNQEYPNIQIAVTAEMHNLNGLPASGFVPIPMALWGKNEQARFIQQWGELWDQFIANKSEDDTSYIDPILLNGWLLNLERAATPFEFTLKVWAAYAGDVRGSTGSDAIEAYIRRMTANVSKARSALDLLASQVVVTMRTALAENDMQLWVGDTEVGSFAASTAEDAASPKDITIPRIILDLTRSGLLATRADSKLSFCHPIITGYLAGQVFADQGSDRVFAQPSWLIKDLTSYYFMGAADNIGYHIHQMLNTSEAPLHQNTLRAGRWLQTIPPESQFRKAVLQQLSGFLQDDHAPMGLRVRVLSALATSGDPGVNGLFRHLLKSEHPNTRQLAALGCGYLRDMQAVKTLINALGDYPNVGMAACLALVNIGTKPALEAVASALLEGDEQVRRAAAEAFALHPAEGHPILRDGSSVDDLLVRRAVIYGLQRVRQAWATQILEELQIEDAQWVVKDAAAQAVEQINATDPAVPQPLEPIHNMPWLIAFASDRGVGISEGEPARKMLLQALREGNENEKLAALGHIQLRGEGGIFPAIYQILYDINPELTDAAYNTIWHAAASGVEVPPPNQFGLG